MSIVFYNSQVYSPPRSSGSQQLALKKPFYTKDISSFHTLSLQVNDRLHVNKVSPLRFSMDNETPVSQIPFVFLNVKTSNGRQDGRIKAINAYKYINNAFQKDFIANITYNTNPQGLWQNILAFFDKLLGKVPIQNGLIALEKFSGPDAIFVGPGIQLKTLKPIHRTLKTLPPGSLSLEKTQQLKDFFTYGRGADIRYLMDNQLALQQTRDFSTLTAIEHAAINTLSSTFFKLLDAQYPQLNNQPIKTLGDLRKLTQIPVMPTQTTVNSGLTYSNTPPYTTKIEDLIFVTFDIRTTGLDRNDDRIIEIGAAKFQGGKTIDTFETFVKPGKLSGFCKNFGEKKIPRHIKEKAHLDDNDFATAPHAFEALQKLYDFMGENPVSVGYNIETFDLEFIRNALGSLGLQHLSNRFASLNAIDLAPLSTNILKNHVGLDYNKRSVVKKTLGMSHIDTHPYQQAVDEGKIFYLLLGRHDLVDLPAPDSLPNTQLRERFKTLQDVYSALKKLGDGTL